MPFLEKEVADLKFICRKVKHIETPPELIQAGKELEAGHYEAFVALIEKVNVILGLSEPVFCFLATYYEKRALSSRRGQCNGRGATSGELARVH